MQWPEVFVLQWNSEPLLGNLGRLNLKNSIQLIPFVGLSLKYAFYPQITGSIPQRTQPWVLSNFSGYYNVYIKQDFGTNIYSGISALVPLKNNRFSLNIAYKLQKINTTKYFKIESVEKYKNLNYTINFFPYGWAQQLQIGINYKLN